MIANTFFRKLWRSLVKSTLSLQGGINEHGVVAQHKLVVADFRFLVQARGNKQARVVRTKWWKLEGKASKVFKEKVIEEGSWNDEGNANSIWEKMTTCVRKVASKVFGVTKESGCDSKDTW